MESPVPYRIDFFALIIFLGAMQGLFLSAFFLNKKNRKYLHNIYSGIFLISLSVVMLDVLLCYTNYMFNVIFLNDSTEPFALVIGPAFYLYFYTKINSRNPKKYYLHFLPALLYFIHSIPFLIQEKAVKYNGYISAYHPNLPFIPEPGKWDYDLFSLRGMIKPFIFTSLVVYSGLIIAETIKSLKNNTLQPEEKKSIISDALIFAGINAVTIIIFVSFDRDFGDYIIVTASALLVYFFTVKILNQSAYFHKKSPEVKYSKSTLSEDEKDEILKRILFQFENEKYFLNPNASLPELSDKIKTSSNYASQVINEKAGKTFFDLIAYYRIEEAKKMLLAGELNETIESIGYTVGYNSKSAFNSAFKKFTGSTPSEFKMQNQKKK